MAETETNKEYAFDVTFTSVIRVKASSEDQARAMIREHLDCADANFGAWPDGAPILAEASVNRDDMTLVEIDDEPVD